MPCRTFLSSEFDRDIDAAKRAAAKEPVVIISNGLPTHVLMTWTQYQRLAGVRGSIVEALAMPGVGEAEFDSPNLPGMAVAADLADGPAARPKPPSPGS